MNDYIVMGLAALTLTSVVAIGIRQAAALSRLKVMLSETLATQDRAARHVQELGDAARRLSAAASIVQEIAPRLESGLNGMTSQLQGMQGPLEALANRLVPSERDAHWIAQAAPGVDGLAALECGLARHPGSRVLLEAAQHALINAGDATQDLAVRRDVVIRLRRHAQLFLQHCAPGDFELGTRVRDEADAMADRVVEAILRRQRDGLENSVTTLVERARQLMQMPRLDAADQEEIALLDQRIDKAALASFEDLKAKYDGVSAELVRYFQEGERTSVAERTRRYNSDALSAASEARAQFDEWQEPWFKDDPPVARFAALLGGWDARLLLPAVSAYTGSVFAEIFQKLDRDQRKALTKQMLDHPSRPLE